MKIYLCAG